MKKIIKILVFICLSLTFYYGNADCGLDPSLPGCEAGGGAGGDNNGEGGNYTATNRTIEVTVTEPIPGADCRAELNPGDETGEDTTGRYVCNVAVGWTSMLRVLGNMIRWLTAVSLLGAVLFLVFNGIHLSMGGLDGEAKGKVKTRIFATLGGIILLLLSGPLLKLIAPWVYT